MSVIYFVYALQCYFNLLSTLVYVKSYFNLLPTLNLDSLGIYPVLYILVIYLVHYEK